MKSNLFKVRNTKTSSLLVSHPVGVTILLAMGLSIPYLLFFDINRLMIERILSCLAFSYIVVFVICMAGRKVWLTGALCLVTLVYAFLINYETGNYLVKGDTFGMEFWQFIGNLTKNTFLLPLQTAPFLASLATLGPFVLVFILFIMLMHMSIKKKRGAPGIAMGLLLFILSGYVNFHYSTARSMVTSYRLFTQMKEDGEQAGYMRKIPARNEIETEKGRNIVHIILESFGDIYTDAERFPGLAPNLAGYKKQGVCAVNMVQTPNQANSYMGHFVVEYGRYYFISPESEEFDTGLGFILKKGGYKNIFIRGAGADMAGPFSRLYSPQNGYDSLYASQNLKNKYDHTFISGFGFSDEVLFQEALEQYTHLIQSDEPFKLTLFTLDMHGFPQGISRVCQEQFVYEGPFDDDQMVQAAHCTDTLVGRFISQLATLPKFEDLLIVIHSDHVQHTVTPAVAPDFQRLYAVIMGKGIEPFQQKEQTHLMDIAPTILALAEVETNARFLAGDNFSRMLKREPVLNRQLEVKYFSNRISYEMFSVLESARKEDVIGKDTKGYEDEAIAIACAGFEGAIFNSYYFYFHHKLEHEPFYILYPVEENLPRVFRPRKGVLLDKLGDGSYSVAVKTGKLSKWSNVLLEDMMTGRRWKIALDEHHNIVSLPQKRLRKTRPIAQKRVFQIKNGEKFTGLNQVVYTGENTFEVEGGDAQIFFEMDLSRRRPHLVEIEMSSEHHDIVKLYYEINDTPLSELNVSSAFLQPGKNTIQLYLPRGVYNERFRFDLGEKTGRFKISSFNVYALKK